MTTPLRAALSGGFLALAASCASAATIAGDAFTFSLSDSVSDYGTLTGIALSAGADISDGLGNISVEVDFVDDDTVDIVFFGGLDSEFDVAYTLSGLDFLDGLLPAPITGVAFNRAGSDIDDFIGDESIGQPPLSAFVEPVVTFTDTAFTASFSYFDPRLTGDGPRLRYDLSFAPTDTPGTVPLPASGLLLAAGLGALAVRRRR